ncbi:MULTISPECIES: ATP-dependent RNA helicase HrpA [unclassified Brevibacterium]|uniref:ATP-dependent RNA helicase HrpA n=1 Tax=unclassified Brevibacterium TaxID=2614124 RepID=UPI001E2ABCCD|nr:MULTISPECIES: ATP-dependent RNA helicase HrpA [unclassified Brevibacterium]MCD1284299.1 ATP-dependent RNA helicase HrpA [Brevibacterium sp. CCUG 69071]MDK8436091.1 ATP-dependent RNA helicase HrpA [Brevibacterium sp. H-BE7]
MAEENPTPSPRTSESSTHQPPRRRKSGRGKPRRKTGAAHHHERRARLKAAREAGQVAITYPAELPVSGAKDEIAAAIRDNQVVIIAGETGSGKTTQLPKICLELGLGVNGLIGHTQPRRIAARTVAERIADELGEELGSTIGYQVRFTAQVADSTRVKVMTDGILLSELSRDKLLRDYEVIIIDEAHERSLNIDFLLGYLKEVLGKRPDLKVIITSATIDPESFSAHFDDAPIISVEGRTYPVEVRYRPLIDETDDDDVDGSGESGSYETGVEEQTEGIISAVDELTAEAPGDILVFLSGEREIRDTADALEAHLRKKPKLGSWEVVPLFARLSAGEQQKVFRPHSRPRIVLATNVAETSLTVPGIKYVIDVGTARISRYSNRTRVQRLPIERISRASANQRKGRSGRTSEGICIRLYSESDFEARPEFTDPEILRTNLASVILQMAGLGFASSDQEILEFSFLTPPEAKAVRDGRTMLAELGALTSDKTGTIAVTEIGRKLSVLPIDPRLARMVIAGAEAGCGGEVTVIVAALSIQDPRERPTEVRAAADEKHARFTHRGSDFLSLLNLWNYLEEQQAALTSSKFRRLCKAEFLNFVRIREWQDLVGQLRSLLGSAGIRVDRSTWRPERSQEAAGDPGADEATGSGKSGHAASAGAAVAARSAGGARSRGAGSTGGASTGAGSSGSTSTGARQTATGASGKIGFAELSAAKRSAKKNGGADDGKGAAQAVANVKLDPHAAAIHRALLAGLLSMIGSRSERQKDYQGARGTRFAIFPGSGLFKVKPDFVMAAELVETSRLWARTVAAIDPDWVVEAAGDLVTRQHSDPHWSKKAGSSMVYEKISLYGVTLISDRRVGYGAIDAEAARDMFIRKGLIEGDWNERFGFLEHNAEVIAEAEDLASRTRNRRVLDQDDALFEFFDERIPATVTSAADFRSWWKGQKRRDSHLLDLTTAVLLSDDSEELTASAASDFPLEWELADGTRAKLRYSFDPGSTEDGVTVEIPAEAVPLVDQDEFSWQVPGLREELVGAYIRSLPKGKRRYFVPAPDVARDILPSLTPYRGSLPEVLAAHLSERAGGGGLHDLVPITVAADDFDRDRIPPHLRIRFRVIDGGRTVGVGEDLAKVTTKAKPQVKKARAKQLDFSPRTGLSTWSFGTLQNPDEAEPGAIPGLADRGTHVDLVTFDTAAQARAASREGLITLLGLQANEALKYLRDGLTTEEKLVLAGHQKFADELLQALLRVGIRGLVAEHVGLVETTWVGDAEAFAQLSRSVQAGLPELCVALLPSLLKALRAATELDRLVSKASSLAILSNLADVQAWRASRVSGPAVAALTPQLLRDLPRWVQAEVVRIGGMQDSPIRDKQLMDRVTGSQDAVDKKVANRFPELAKADWSQILVALPNDWSEVLTMVEELRVSFYANSVGTAHPVSEKRIAKALAQL